MKNDKDEELRNFFMFLSSEKDQSSIDKIKTEELIFGIDCYLNELPESTKRKLKDLVYAKSKENMIAYEDFKNMWNFNSDKSLNVSVKDVNNEVFNLITEFLNKEKQVDRITKSDLVYMLKDLNIILNNNINIDIEDVNDEIYVKVAKEMIDSVCLDNKGYVSKKEFEFLVSEYLNSNK